MSTRQRPLLALLLLGSGVIALLVGLVATGRLGFNALPSAYNDSPSPAVTVSPPGDYSREIENMAAFTRLLAYVRYFHPSDAVAGTDWDAFAASQITAVEAAPDAAALAGQLGALFGPYAPTLQVYPADARPAPPAALQPPADTDGVALTMWVHVPMRDTEHSSPNLRPGERIRIPLTGGRAPATVDYAVPHYFPAPVSLPVPDPGAPIEVDLGGGVRALLPLALYADEAGTLPRAELPAAPAPADARAERLATVAATWGAFRHLWAYGEGMELNWDDVLREALAAADTDADGAAFLRTLRRLTARFGDGHTVTTHPDHDPRRGYVLPFTWDIIEGRLAVTTALPASPLRPGDVVISIEGRPAESVLAAALAEQPGFAQFGTYSALRELASSPTARSLALTVQPHDGLPARELSVDYIPADEVGEALPHREPRPDTVATLDGGVQYVDLTRLTEEELPATVERLREADGIIFDMRGYPTSQAPFHLLAHLAEAPLAGAPFLVPVVTRPDGQELHFVQVTSSWPQPAEPRLTPNRAFLLNGNGVLSFAETILGLVEGNGLGALVGEPSAGANGNMLDLPLPGDYRTSWTGLRVLRHDGSPLFRVGVQPTHPVTRTLGGVAAGRDELLETALALVLSGEAVHTEPLQPAPTIAPANSQPAAGAPVAVEALALVTYRDPAGRFAARVPEGWAEGTPGTFSSSEQGTLAALSFEVTPAAELAANIPADAGQETLEVAGQQWTLFTYPLAINGSQFLVQAAVLTEDETAFMVALISTEAERDSLRDGLLLPVLEAHERL